MKGWLKGGLIVLAAGTVCGVGLLGWVVWQRYHLPEVVPSDALIVLGAQVKPDGTPSEILAIRLETALKTYLKHPQTIITCGAQGDNEPMAEGDMMRDWLIARGVEPEDVAAETASFNTRQNLRNARAIMEARGLAQATVITSDYHVARALKLCGQEGISATGIASHTYWVYLPRNYLRESLSWVKVWLETMLS